MWSFLCATIAAYWIGELTDENVSLAKTLSWFVISDRLFGNIKYPNLQPPAPHHLLKPVLIIVFSGEKFDIDW